MLLFTINPNNNIVLKIKLVQVLLPKVPKKYETGL